MSRPSSVTVSRPADPSLPNFDIWTWVRNKPGQKIHIVHPMWERFLCGFGAQEGSINIMPTSRGQVCGMCLRSWAFLEREGWDQHHPGLIKTKEIA